MAAVRHLPVGVMAILISTVPMMTLALAVGIGRERAGPPRLAGIGLGLAAMLMIALPEAALPEPEKAIWVLPALMVAASYAAENVYLDARRPPGLDPLQTMAGLSLGATALAWPAVWATGSWVSLAAWGPAEWAVVGSTALHVGAYWGFVWLIARAGPVYAAQVAYVVTMSGIFWGMAVLGESHSAWVWAALLPLGAGLALVRPREA